MKKFLFLFAVAGLLLVSCEKDDTSSDLVGVWVNTNENYGDEFEFKADGSFIETPDQGEPQNGTWKVSKNGVLSITMGGEEMQWNVRLEGGKTALVLVEEYDGRSGQKERSYSMYYKKNAKVTSTALSDGPEG